MATYHIDAFIRAALPPFIRGPNMIRMCRNMAFGGSRMRSFAAEAAPLPDVRRALLEWAKKVGAVPRTLKPRTALWTLR